MTHPGAEGTPAEVPKNLDRVSAGLEDPKDISQDLLESLDSCKK